ncbi:uncharacterized protein [Diadema antillarum]|uniref:uncharacterized protein n=1 Tax=Diadema antillarum TaxID=105358 RepID=UPI003A882FEC
MSVLSSYAFLATVVIELLAITRSVQAALYECECPPDMVNCTNGPEIGLVSFHSIGFNTVEYGHEGYFKDLVCDPQNFCRTEWLKDGLQYPWGWSDAELEFVGVTRSKCNAILEFRTLPLTAAGVYTCLVHGANGTTVSRNITLKVQKAPRPVPPIAVAGSQCTNQTAVIGSAVTFSCDVFVGADRIDQWTVMWLTQGGPDEWDLADSANHLSGAQVSTTSSVISEEYINAVLHIGNATTEAFSDYELYVYAGLTSSGRTFTLRQHVQAGGNEHSNEAPRPVPPIPVAGSQCTNQTAVIGSAVTFSCDVFVGADRIDQWTAMWLTQEWDLADSVSHLSGALVSTTSR